MEIDVRTIEKEFLKIKKKSDIAQKITKNINPKFLFDKVCEIFN